MANQRTAIITDSAAVFSGGVPDGVRCLPLRILLGDRDEPDDGRISVTQVLAERAAGRKVTTSRPSPGQFLELFDQYARLGFSEILVISMSAELSGTFMAAQLAAGAASIPVYCCDSQSLGLGQGFLVEQAIHAARVGYSGAELVDLVRRRAAAARGFFVFHKGAIADSGRLSQLPVVHPAPGFGLGVQLAAGRLSPTGSVAAMGRTFLLDHAVESLDLGHRVGITHVGNAAGAEEFARQLAQLVPHAPVVVAQASAVLAVHGGAEAMGFLSLPGTELG